MELEYGIAGSGIIYNSDPENEGIWLGMTPQNQGIQEVIFYSATQWDQELRHHA